MVEQIPEVWQSILMAILGMIIHFLKKKVKRESEIAWSDFLRNNRDKTILAFFVTMSAIILADLGGILNPTASFFIGYAGDSILNKWDKKMEKEN